MANADTTNGNPPDVLFLLIDFMLFSYCFILDMNAKLSKKVLNLKVFKINTVLTIHERF